MTDRRQRGPRAYSDAGIDYASLDAGKRLALTAALSTSHLLTTHNGQAVDQSRGEPAFVFNFGDTHFAFVLEGLGTKSMIARRANVDRGFEHVAYDTVAAIVNDLCCVGALPLVVNAYFATGSSDWYTDGSRHADLLRGWQRACEDAVCTWGGGESPSLPELVASSEIELAGSAIGAVPEGSKPILGEELASGDEIVLIGSSGLHANGASLARLVAKDLDVDYETKLSSEQTFGEALLTPSRMYVALVRELIEQGLPVTYLSHITGHGLLKLMRPSRPFTYRIHALPEVPEVLTFLVEKAQMSSSAAYSTFNMGAGFAVYTSAGTGAAVVELALNLGFDAIIAGEVHDGPRQVMLEPLDVIYSSDDLQLAPAKPVAAPSNGRPISVNGSRA